MLATRFLDDLESTGTAIVEAPLRFPISRHDAEHREALLRRFAYRVVFALEPDEVLVVAVDHQRSEPGR